MVQRIRISINRSAARGPIQDNGVGHSTHRAVGIHRDRCPTPCWPVERSPWRAPVRQAAPRAGPVFASRYYDEFMDGSWPHVTQPARQNLASRQNESAASFIVSDFLSSSLRSGFCISDFLFVKNSGTSSHRRAAACATPGTPPGRSSLPGSPAPFSCRASSPDAAATPSLADNCATSAPPPR